MADIDLDSVPHERGCAHWIEPGCITDPCECWRGQLEAEIRRLRDIEEWAADADHHAGCSGGYGPQYRCKCGRRGLFG